MPTGLTHRKWVLSDLFGFPMLISFRFSFYSLIFKAFVYAWYTKLATCQSSSTQNTVF